MKASESKYRKIVVIPTGFGNLDHILGLGGIPRRRITEISGPYSVGKTTLGLSIVASAQKLGLRCLWADIEWSFDENYAVGLGVNIDKLDFVQEQYAEAALDAIETALQRKETDVVVIDSIGGLLPRAEAEKTSDGRMIGGQARLVASFCRKVVPLLAMNNVALIVLNHSFTDIMTGKLKTSGGMKLEYHKSVWIRLRNANKRVMQGEKMVGRIIEAKVGKNKLASTEGQETELTLLFGSGFSAEADLLTQLLDKGSILKKGNTYWYGEFKMGIGLTQARTWLKEHPELV